MKVRSDVVVRRHSPARVKELILLGVERNRVKGRAGKPRGGWSQHHFAGFKDVMTHIRGACSEGIVADYLGVDVDTSLDFHGDKGWDLVLEDGRTVQVKSRESYYPDAYLYFNDLSKFKADLAVLVCPVVGVIEWAIMGWMGRGEFVEVCGPINLNYGSRVMVTAWELHHISELL